MWLGTVFAHNVLDTDSEHSKGIRDVGTVATPRHRFRARQCGPLLPRQLDQPLYPCVELRGLHVVGKSTERGFLTFFMLCTKDQMAIRTNGLFSSKIDAARFITNLNQMIHGFVAGNLIVGSVVAL